MPTQATRPNAQVWKVSTAGDAASTWWLGTVEAGPGRRRGRAGRRGSAYFEWACPDRARPDRRRHLAAVSPGVRADDRRRRRCAAALDMLGPDEFARAYGNRWVSTTARVIPLDAWRAADRPEPTPSPTLAGSPRFRRGRRPVRRGDRGRLARRGRPGAMSRSPTTGPASGGSPTGSPSWSTGGGRSSVGVRRRRPGAGRRRRPRPGPGSTSAGLESPREYAAACAGCSRRSWPTRRRSRYRPHPALDAAADDAARRALGDAWAWGRRQSVGVPRRR